MEEVRKKLGAGLRYCAVLAVLVLGLASIIGTGDDDWTYVPPTESSPVFQTQLGDIRCAKEGTVIACRGIPYAEPPVGTLRFAPPVKYETPWSGVRDATTFGDKCIQDDGSGSEDCLYLNVFAPVEDTGEDEGLPVMFWIHGGAYIQGSSCNPGYDMPDLVREGVIVVTINYRLNAFGFLPHPALEDPTGNFGLKDQVMALEWVQDNIEAFGGDPGNVTIFGESAGGHSVLSLMAARSDIVDGLFHKAVVQSGSYSPEQMDLSIGYYLLGTPFTNLCEGTESNEETRACLRDLSIEEIMGTQLNSPGWAWFTPVYAADTFLPQSIDGALSSGEYADVPIMIGCNLHEGTLFAGLFLGGFGYMNTEDQYRAGVAAFLAASGDAVAGAVADYYLGVAKEMWGESHPNRFRNAYSMIWTDATFTVSNAVQWGQIASNERTVYGYWFTDEDAPINETYSALGALSPLLSFGRYGLGASHSFEIQYVFGTLRDHPEATREQKALSDRMIGYWTDFAKDGSPAGETWPGLDMGCFDGSNDECIMKLHPTGDEVVGIFEEGKFGDAHHLDFWYTLSSPDW